MSSIMRSLLARTSLSVEEGNTTASSTAPASPSSPFSSSMPTVPSFNDFSMHVSQDAEMETPAQPPARRGESLDIAPTYSARSSLDLGSNEGGNPFRATSWHPSSANWPTGLLPKSAAITIPSSGASSPPTPKSTAPIDAPRRKRPEGKINGMAYYDFCELIRSSSL